MPPISQKIAIGPNIIDHKIAVSKLPAIKADPTIFQFTVPIWEETPAAIMFLFRCQIGEISFQALLV
jgi:hypothetical protein